MVSPGNREENKRDWIWLEAGGKGRSRDSHVYAYRRTRVAWLWLTSSFWSCSGRLLSRCMFLIFSQPLAILHPLWSVLYCRVSGFFEPSQVFVSSLPGSALLGRLTEYPGIQVATLNLRRSLRKHTGTSRPVSVVGSPGRARWRCCSCSRRTMRSEGCECALSTSSMLLVEVVPALQPAHNFVPPPARNENGQW